MIVDTHVHVVSPDESRYPLRPSGVGSQWFREDPVSAEAFLGLMDEAGVDQAVLVQAVGAYFQDNTYVADSVAAHRPRVAGVASVDLAAADCVEQLERWCGGTALSGVRIFAIGPDGGLSLGSERARELYARAAARDDRIVVTILADQLPALDTLLTEHPQTPISLDHCGFPIFDASVWDGTAPLYGLARHEALHLKVSTHVLHEAERAGDRKAFVAQLVKHFGASRLQWGSDFFQTREGSYADMVEYGRASFADLPSRERDDCLGGTARSLWRELA